MTRIDPPRDVAADMEQVFGGIPAQSRVAVPVLPGPVAARRRSWRRWIVLAAVLAALAIAAVIVAARFAGQRDGDARDDGSRTADVSAVATRVAVPPRDLPRSSPPLPAPAPVVATPTPAVPPTPAPSPSPPSSSSPTAQRTVERRATPTPGPTRLAAVARGSGVRRAALCRGARDRTACYFREVRGADLRMRRAYERAVDSDLPTGRLADVRHEWNEALYASQDDPVGAVAVMDQLTTQLYNDIGRGR